LNRQVFLITLATTFAGLILSALSDIAIFIADASISDDEVTSSVGKASYSSATTTTTVMMYTSRNE
jgi:hypothetical protein